MKVKVCKVSDLKEGRSQVARVLTRRIAVFRIDGMLYAIEGDCKHQKASIADGDLDGTIVTCPVHAWKYDITTGECLNEPWAKLKTYVVSIEDDHIWVETDQ